MEGDTPAFIIAQGLGNRIVVNYFTSKASTGS